MPSRRRALSLAHGMYQPHHLRHSQDKPERGICTQVASWPLQELTPLFLADASFGRPSLYADCKGRASPLWFGSNLVLSLHSGSPMSLE